MLDPSSRGFLCLKRKNHYNVEWIGHLNLNLSKITTNKSKSHNISDKLKARNVIRFSRFILFLYFSGKEPIEIMVMCGLVG